MSISQFLIDNTPVDNTPVDNTPVDNTPVDNTSDSGVDSDEDKTDKAVQFFSGLMSAKHGGGSHKGNSSGSGGISLAVMTRALNYSGVADKLETVLNDIKSWKAALPDINTIQSENILEGIISALRHLSNNSGGVEAVVSGLRSELGIEVAKRESLEGEVKDLKAKVTHLTAKEADGQAVDFLAVVMAMLKTFIFRVELTTGIYSVDFKKANDREIIDALFPEPIDPILDSSDEQAYKIKLSKLNVEALAFVSKLGLDPQLIFDLNNLVQARNQSAHAMNNKRFKESTYVEGKLDEFSTLIDKLPVESALVPVKEPLKNMVTDLKVLHKKYLGVGKFPII